MYDQNDSYLVRVEKGDPSKRRKKNKMIVICHDCDDVEMLKVKYPELKNTKFTIEDCTPPNIKNNDTETGR